MKILFVLLIIGSIFLGGIGFLSLTKATIGVGLIATSAVLAILARIIQADSFHRDILETIHKMKTSDKSVACSHSDKRQCE